jgi:hypothetical protein
MIDRIIIITTAISRIGLHNITFPIYKEFLGNDYDVKWFINIDTPNYCSDNPDDVEHNLRTILDIYELFIYKTKIPNFFNAVKTLLVASKEFLTDNCCILWLEDDWTTNKKCTLKYFVDNFLQPFSFISLVYNKLGSFPPFIMGPQLAKIFYNKYVQLNLPRRNPESVSRRILRTIAKKMGIVYYDYIENLALVEKITKSVPSGLVYKERYLEITDCKILTDGLDDNYFVYCGDVSLPMESVHTYKNQTYNKIVFLRFGTTESNAKYKHSFFKDLGRQWKKSLKLKSDL